MGKDADTLRYLYHIKFSDDVETRITLFRTQSLINAIKLGVFRSPKIKHNGIYHTRSVFGFDVVKQTAIERTVPLEVNFKPEIITTMIYTRFSPPYFQILRNTTSIGIYGITGCGKSELAYGIVKAQLKEGQKFHIISVKPYDKWLSLDGFRIVTIKNGAPNPFLHDIEILIHSVTLAISSISSQGINANAMESIMRKACNPAPKNWSEILKRLEKMKKESDLGAGHESLMLKIEEFASIPVIDDFEITKENIVFNFEGIEKERLVFWANMVMSVAYEKMKGDTNRDLTLVCDEAHMIIPADPESAKHSIVNSIARFGRAFGSWFIISQMMSDIPYFIRENCGMIFAFGTQSALELGLVSDRLMKWTLAHLQQYEFIDLRVNYGTFVPILQYFSVETRKDRGESPISRERIISVPENTSEKTEIKKAVTEEDVLQYLENCVESQYSRQISNALASQFGLKKDPTSLRVNQLLRKMDTVSKDKVEDYLEGKDTERFYYCPSNTDKLHVFLVRRIVGEIKSRTRLEIKYVSEGVGTFGGVDVSTNLFDVEVESGKMNDETNLLRRIELSENNVVIVVPNYEVKVEYLKKQYPKTVEVATLREFVKKLEVSKCNF